MDKKLLHAILLKNVCIEIDERRNMSMRSDRRYRSLVYYRCMLSVIFRDKYGLTFESIGNEFHKNHATIINAYKKGKWLLDMRYSDAIEVYEDVKSIVSYCEVIMGMSTETETAISTSIINLFDSLIEQEDLPPSKKSMIAYGVINIISEKYCL